MQSNTRISTFPSPSHPHIVQIPLLVLAAPFCVLIYYHTLTTGNIIFRACCCECLLLTWCLRPIKQTMPDVSFSFHPCFSAAVSALLPLLSANDQQAACRIMRGERVVWDAPQLPLGTSQAPGQKHVSQPPKSEMEGRLVGFRKKSLYTPTTCMYHFV